MNYATIKYYDIANGPGVRTSVFVSGCRHHCPGCFNEVAWDFGYGKPFDKVTRNEVFASCQPGQWCRQPETNTLVRTPGPLAMS